MSLDAAQNAKDAAQKKAEAEEPPPLEPEFPWESRYLRLDPWIFDLQKTSLT
jgi:hypothetical protein